MSIFAQAELALHKATSKANGGTVTFTRPAVGSVSVTATFGRSVLEIDYGAGARIEAESNDFIVLAAALVVGGAVVVPNEGDRIIRVTGALVETFEVMTPPYKPSGNANVLIRIHTKRIAN